MAKVTLELTDSEIAYLLCSAYEGGSNYWAEFDEAPYNCGAGTILPLRLPVIVRDIEEDGRPHTLDRAAIERH